MIGLCPVPYLIQKKSGGQYMQLQVYSEKFNLFFNKARKRKA